MMIAKAPITSANSVISDNDSYLRTSFIEDSPSVSGIACHHWAGFPAHYCMALSGRKRTFQKGRFTARRRNHEYRVDSCAKFQFMSSKISTENWSAQISQAGFEFVVPSLLKYRISNSRVEFQIGCYGIE